MKDHEIGPNTLKLANVMSAITDDRVKPEDIIWLSCWMQADMMRDMTKKDFAEEILAGRKPMTMAMVEEWITNQLEFMSWPAITNWIEEEFYN